MCSSVPCHPAHPPGVAAATEPAKCVNASTIRGTRGCSFMRSILLFAACKLGRHFEEHSLFGKALPHFTAFPAVSGAAIVRMKVMTASTIRYTEIGHVAPPAHAINVAAANGVRPPLI